ncbi:hypothetical protein [Robertmurraya massiliosenegalensis]|uniref:hypothetical protein n=1 Tax=Robertmurraya massiliosenegalensis TaxID=1287657 RepID=UPI000367AB51|nr:hypothetical protein [Robertmurraya massiliosenegalensis]
MKTLLAIIMLISILVIFLFRNMQRSFPQLEVTILFFFVSFLCQHINFKISTAYERLFLTAEYIPRIIGFLHFGWIIPVLLVWALYRQKRAHTIWYVLGWCCLEVLSKFLFLKVGVVQCDSEWVFMIDVIMCLLIVIISSLFQRYYDHLLKRESVAVE